MPRLKTEKERRYAAAWAKWLAAAMDEQDVQAYRLVELCAALGATFNGPSVSKWRAGAYAAEPDNVLFIASALRRDPVEALRAAGHHVVADGVEFPGTGPGDAAVWQKWVLGAAGGADAVLELAVSSNGGIPARTAQAWVTGEHTAAPTSAMLAARLLGADELEALRAAGHHGLAEQVEWIVRARNSGAAHDAPDSGGARASL